MAFIRTLNGDIAPEKLGVTYAHDHLFCIPPLWKEKKFDDFLIDDIESSIRDVALFTAAGGQAVYDATAIDYGRAPKALKAIADRTGIKIIATAGFNKAIMWPGQMAGTGGTFQAWIDARSRAEIRDHVVHELTVGLDGTALKGGAGRVWGTICGAFILELVGNIMLLSNFISEYLIGAIQGAIIIIAMLVQRSLVRKS